MNLNTIPLFSMLTERLSWLGQRQQVLANNVANVDTPGFKPVDLAPINFERLAEDASRQFPIASTNSQHLVSSARSSGPYRVTAQNAISGSNSVVLEEQLMMISQTVMEHRITAGLYAKHMCMIRTAIGRT
ncbi:MAG: flagellar basal body protein [Alphaproteobacteria bacterium]|jgi:flagellar basal-body rod protein FlgB